MDKYKECLGIGFIKSRKSVDKLMDMGEVLIAKASKYGVKISEVIIDTSSGVDIDRSTIDNLIEWMEKDYIKTIIVYSVFDITSDVDDLRAFFEKANELDVSIYSIEHGFQQTYIPWDGGIGC